MGWHTKAAMALIAASVILYTMHYLIFQDLHHIAIYTLGDIAFMPVEVLVVSLIIHRLLSEREKRQRLEKLNMVIGTFYSEVGTHTLKKLADADPENKEKTNHLKLTNEWKDQDFKKVADTIKKMQYDIDIRKIDLPEFSAYLLEKRDFMLRLLENPTILEHETFTDLLRAVFHLIEELQNRKDLRKLPETDLKHLEGDVKRVYGLMVMEWIAYMHHLKDNYPYLFSLAIRTNPFDKDATPTVK
ncbi:MAG: hypothetical protein KKD39_01795 [Candidatus Altiarchaeota archaeon]|nr:hypothetical protein [Candidatus Altiarchaeota archaeon]